MDDLLAFELYYHVICIIMNSGWELVLQYMALLLCFSSAKCGQLNTLENLQSQIHWQQYFLFPHPLMYNWPQHYKLFLQALGLVEFPISGEGS